MFHGSRTQLAPVDRARYGPLCRGCGPSIIARTDQSHFVRALVELLAEAKGDQAFDDEPHKI